jgi:hypothetical protein
LTSKTATIVFSYRRAIMAEMLTAGQSTLLVCTESDARCGVFCVEEKIQIQALDCKNPVPPLSAGKPFLVCNPSKLTR